MRRMRPDDPIPKHFRLGETQRKGLAKLGIATIRDLLFHFPFRYDQGGGEASIGALRPGTAATVFGTIGKLETRRSWKRKIPVGEAVLTDGSGSISVMWFHQPYLAKKFAEGAFVKATGTVGGTGGRLYLANPHVEPAEPAERGLFAKTTGGEPGTLFAIYPESRGITSLWIRHAIRKAISQEAVARIDDPLPAALRKRYRLPDLASSLLYMHAPENMRHAEAARKRFAFEEIFAIQLAKAAQRVENDAQGAFAIPAAASLAERFLASSDISATLAQRRAVRDIAADLGKPHPMARLLEGDVGSGKTLVAAATAYAVVNSRPPGRGSGTLQAAYMAPTELLAAQHFDSFIRYFRHLPIAIGLLTGSGCRKFPSKLSPGAATSVSRTQLLSWVKGGEIAMLIGTHALIQKSVHFQNLAYAIVDEQHRFGTRQRRDLSGKNGGGAQPHFLSMSATPIPRTLALTMYGDLDLSVLDELPPGRARVETKILKAAARETAYEALRKEMRAGRQSYVICPRIDEPDPAKASALRAKSAKAEAARLKRDVFAEFEVGLLHGAMKPAEKDSVMQRFASGGIDLLVATSVVEVGVNVPNATAILIEGAERFGLAQLHQLRGRVMRSSHRPLCFLIAESASEPSLRRLRALALSDDGFKLAEADLAARGAGDLYGRQQWGVSDLGMEALKNPRLIEAARAEARTLVAAGWKRSEASPLAERVRRAAEALQVE